jgi:pseudaminic acid synthase
MEFVAEISCNHEGSLRAATDLVQRAAWAGATAVKFQCWSRDRMVIAADRQIKGSAWDGRNLKELYDQAYTPWEWFPDLFSAAKEASLDCFVSVFDAGALEHMEKLACPRYKIASFEITDLPLIRAVASTGKPIVISTGMSTFPEILRAYDAAQKAKSITLLKCTSAYPAPIDSANLQAMSALPKPYGVSDHTKGHLVPVVATTLGASMIEKHLALPGSRSPDAAFSMTPSEYSMMVDACVDASRALGQITFGPTEAERDSLQFRRSLYAISGIRKGTVMTRFIVDRAVASARPALGLPPDYNLVGLTAAVDIVPGTPLQESFFES